MRYSMQRFQNRIFLVLLPVLFAFIPGALALQTQRRSSETSPAQPKLVLLIVVDQFRYDYLTRWRDQYTGGIARLLDHGAVFTNANYEHYPTVTAVGHATILSGASPALSGIVGNDWYDRESGKQITSVSDESVKLLGGPPEAGSSPRRMLVSTLGDELKMSNGGASRVIGISLKDRSAILSVGHAADAAYWFDTTTGNFVSSTYYFSNLPNWVKDFNQNRAADHYAGKKWDVPGETNTRILNMPPEPGQALYEAVYNSAFGNELLANFTQQALADEKLGQRGVTDILSVSFSSNDTVGHVVGPDSPAVRDLSIRTDRLIGSLLDQIDKTIGLDQVLVILTADHGVAPLPEILRERKLPGGRMESATLFNPIQAALEEAYGSGKWILATAGTSPYLNHALIAEKNLDRTEVRRVAASAVAAVPHVLRVYTWNQLQSGETNGDLFSQRVLRSFNPVRSGDLEVLLDPYWIRRSTGTTHGTPYSYDTHVPLILMGPGIRPGKYSQNVAMNDLAPTLATLLEIETPNGSVGRVLREALQ